jgi:hypothetical protein
MPENHGMPTADEMKMLLLAIAEFGDQVQELRQDRNDLLVGAVAAFLDIHRSLAGKDIDSKNDAIASLEAQRDWLKLYAPKTAGATMLDYLIASLVSDKFDAAELMHDYRALDPELTGTLWTPSGASDAGRLSLLTQEPVPAAASGDAQPRHNALPFA